MTKRKTEEKKDEDGGYREEYPGTGGVQSPDPLAAQKIYTKAEGYKDREGQGEASNQANVTDEGPDGQKE